MKGHYEGSGIDKKTMHAMKARKLASDVSFHGSHAHFGFQIAVFLHLLYSFTHTKEMIGIISIM